MTPPKTLLYTDTPPAQGREQLGTLVFVHGWPDSASLWDGQVERLSREGYRCVCVTLPGFGTSALDRAHRFGYTFVEIADALARLIREEIATGEDQQVTLVVHDWGSYFGFFAQNLYPTLVRAVVAMDVGPPLFGRAPPWRTMPVIVLAGLIYQYWLILAWAIALFVPFGLGRPLGDALARLVARSTGAGTPPPTAIAKAENCYPYFYMHYGMWAERLGFKKPDGNRPRSRAEVPSCPCLFFWGKGKGFKFHSEPWARALEARTDGSRVVALERAKHWLMIDEREAVNDRIVQWLALLDDEDLVEL